MRAAHIVPAVSVLLRERLFPKTAEIICDVLRKTNGFEFRTPPLQLSAGAGFLTVSVWKAGRTGFLDRQTGTGFGQEKSR